VLNLLRQDKTREEIAPELRELGRRYLALALWRDAVPEGWFKEWPKEDSRKKKRSKPAARRSGKRRVKKNREES
jgi:hypothetical protein